MMEARATRIRIKTYSQLVAQQYAGHYETNDERMMKYVTNIRNKTAQLEELTIEQIPREENDRVDTIARMASGAERSWNGEITLLQETRGKEDVSIMEICTKSDWRVPIIHFLKTGQHAGLETVMRTSYDRYCIINDQLFKRSFTSPYLKCLGSEEAEYALTEIHSNLRRCGKTRLGEWQKEKARKMEYCRNAHIDQESRRRQAQPKCYLSFLVGDKRRRKINVVGLLKGPRLGTNGKISGKKTKNLGEGRKLGLMNSRRRQPCTVHPSIRDLMRHN